MKTSTIKNLAQTEKWSNLGIVASRARLMQTFLEKHGAWFKIFEFAKDLTLEQFLETCPRGDWILWLFARTNPNSLKELTLAKAHCANTVRHLITDKRSLNALNVAFEFGEGKATIEELNAASLSAFAAFSFSDTPADTAAYFAAADDASNGYFAAGSASSAAFGIDATLADAARKQNQKQTADICRKFLPIQIWDQSQF